MKPALITTTILALGLITFAQQPQQAPVNRNQVDYSKPVSINGKAQATNSNKVRPATTSYNTPVAVPANHTNKRAG
ncbi:MAG: hypothetical protein RLZZ367_379, partial [Bacteroidota bacterium]